MSAAWCAGKPHTPRTTFRRRPTRLSRDALPSRFYCNRKPPISASGQHRFTKHPAPIFKKKAPHRHLTPPSILRKLAFLNRWGRGKFVKKLYKKVPSPIVKFLVSGCKKLIRTPPSPPSSLNAPPRSCPSQMPPFRPLLEKTHVFRQIGTGLFCPKIRQNKPVPNCPKSFRCA